LFDTPDANSNVGAGIFSQPQCWRDCLASVNDDSKLAEIAKTFRSTPEWLFVGCGSSYYI